MSWSFRVYKRPCPNYEDCEYSLREHYDDIGSYTQDAQAASVLEVSDTKALASLRWQLQEMLKALDQPILIDDGE